MTLNADRAALAARFATITGLRVHETPPPRAEPPFAFIGTMTRDPGRTFDGAATNRFDVFICLSSVIDQRSTEELDNYADSTGSKSVEVALSNTAAYLLVEVQSPVTVNVAGVDYTAAQFTVELFN